MQRCVFATLVSNGGSEIFSQTCSMTNSFSGEGCFTSGPEEVNAMKTVASSKCRRIQPLIRSTYGEGKEEAGKLYQCCVQLVRGSPWWIV